MGLQNGGLQNGLSSQKHAEHEHAADPGASTPAQAQEASPEKPESGGKTLAGWREEIDALDGELLRLLNRRAAIACEIARVKVASAIPAYDAKREAQVLERVAAKNAGPFDDESVQAIFRSVIHETRRLGTQKMRE